MVDIAQALKNFTFKGGDAGLANINWGKIIPAAAGIYGIKSLADSSFANSSSQPVGYQGGIPNYVATRSTVPPVPVEGDTVRRPGQSGQRYFTDVDYSVNSGSPIMGKTAAQLSAENAAALQRQKDSEALFQQLLGLGVDSSTTTPTTTPTPTPARITTTASPSGMTNQIGGAADTAWMSRSAGFDDARWKNVMDTWAAQNPNATRAQVERALSEFNVPVQLHYYAYNRSGIDDDGRTNETGIRETDAAWMQKAQNFDDQRWKNIIDVWAAQNPNATLAQANKAMDNFDVPESLTDYVRSKIKTGYAQGGLMSLPQSKGYYLGGPTDGMADKVPARIDGAQEAALSDGEFVLPADIVSHLGNGNSQAGAQVLYDMMERVRKARTGRPEQGRQINPNKYTPA
jgi:hypothetical protein